MRLLHKRVRPSHNHNLVGNGALAFGVVWVVWALVWLAATAGLVYVAWHFISKFW